MKKQTKKTNQPVIYKPKTSVVKRAHEIILLWSNDDIDVQVVGLNLLKEGCQDEPLLALVVMRELPEEMRDEFLSDFIFFICS